MTYLSKQLHPNDSASLQHLFQMCYPTNKHISPGAIHWSFFHPQFKQKLVSFVAYAKDIPNQIVSHYGNQWLPIAINDSTLHTYLCLDMATHPDHRGKRLVSILSKQVYELLRQQHVDFSFGFSNKFGIQVDKHASNYGYNIVGQFEKFVAYPKIDRSYDFSESQPTTTAALPPNQYGLAKNLEYLQWRYFDKPHRPYLSFKFTHQSSYGWIIARKHKLMLDIMDIIIPEWSDQKYLNACIATRILATHLHSAGCSTQIMPNPYMRKLFKQAGFFQIPHVLVSNPFWLTIKLHNQNHPKALNPSSWWLMSGDIL